MLWNEKEISGIVFSTSIACYTSLKINNNILHNMHTHTHTHINTLNAYKKINQAENILCPSNIEEFPEEHHFIINSWLCHCIALCIQSMSGEKKQHDSHLVRKDKDVNEHPTFK